MLPMSRPTIRPPENTRVPTVVAVVVAVVAAGCSAGTPASSTTTPANRVDCSGVIAFQEQPSPEFFRRVVDVVALPVDPLDFGRDGEPGTPYEGLRFAKFGLIIRADHAVNIEIVEVEPGRALMQWTPLQDPDRPSTALDVGPCPGDGHAWIVFSGGLWVSNDPTCVTLAITSAGRTEKARLGVEVPCP